MRASWEKEFWPDERDIGGIDTLIGQNMPYDIIMRPKHHSEITDDLSFPARSQRVRIDQEAIDDQKFQEKIERKRFIERIERETNEAFICQGLA